MKINIYVGQQGFVLIEPRAKAEISLSWVLFIFLTAVLAEFSSHFC